MDSNHYLSCLSEQDLCQVKGGAARVVSKLRFTPRNVYGFFSCCNGKPDTTYVKRPIIFKPIRKK